jgi:hypothetical protein
MNITQNIINKNMLKIILLFLLLTNISSATELIYSFKSPSFTGVGYSSHALTLETLAFNRKQTKKDKLLAAQAIARANELNTPINQFILNLQARVYSQIAAQVTNQLFQTGVTFGTFDLPDGAFINWTVDNGVAILSIFDASTNTTTTLKIPVGTLIIASGGG